MVPERPPEPHLLPQISPDLPRSVRSISILMPVFNGEAFLDRVLASLATQQIDLPWTFLAIDSGSTDRTLQILDSWRRQFPVELRVTHVHPSAFDHGDTRNLLAAESTGELMVFLTQDAIPRESDWLSRLAGNFNDPTVGAAYCRNVPRAEAHLLTRVFSEHDPGYAAQRRVQRLLPGASVSAMTPDERRLLFNLNNVAAAYRRDLWEHHPFPRTEFGEDVLMARALIEAGYSVVYDDLAIVEHSHDYQPHAMRERARIDGRFNAEWLDRVCVTSRHAALLLTRRQLIRDRQALESAQISGEELSRQLQYASRLRRAAFMGLYEGGLTRERRPRTRMRERSTLRILYVVHAFPPDTWAGTEVYTLGLALEMQKRGHEVTVLTRAPAHESVENGGPAEFSTHLSEFKGLPVWRMINRLLPSSLRATYNEPRADAAFRDILLRVKPDVVHFQHLIHLSASLPHVCRELGTPSLLTANDYWALCARVQLIRPDGVRCENNQGQGCLLCVASRQYKQIPVAKRLLPLLDPAVRALAWTSDIPGMRRLGELGGQMRDMMDRLDYICEALAACDLVIAPSRFLRQKLLDTGKFRPHAVVYSDYGTATEHIGGFTRTRDPKAPVRFGFIGSLLWYKGVDVLITAMQHLDREHAVLHVFGEFKPLEEAYHAHLEEIARPCGERIQFHGRFDNSRLSDVYQHIDVLVVPSVWFENSPVTIHESFLCGTPVVTSNIGGMAELVQSGVNGLLFSAGDSRDLAATLRRFCDEPDLLHRLSDFPRLKTMTDDAREMEVRYRALACVVRQPSRPVFIDRAGWDTQQWDGPAEQQGNGLALLRPGAWVEYDISTVPPGPIVVRVAVQAFAGEANVLLGGTVLIDGAVLGQIEPFASTGQNEVRTAAFQTMLSAPAKRLRVTSRTDRGDLFLRIARVTVAEGPPASAAQVDQAFG